MARDGGSPGRHQTCDAPHPGPLPEGEGGRRPAPAQKAKPTAIPAPSSFEAERRALLAEAAPIVKAVTDQLVADGFVGEDAWLAELERRVASYNPLPGNYVPIAAGSPNVNGRAVSKKA